MGIWAGIKHALNSSLGTPYFRSLDKMISATMILEGASGTQFAITNTTTGDTFSITLASGENRAVVPVPLGIYNITVTYGAKSVQTNVTVDALGQPYKIPYKIEIARYTSNGTFTVPEGLNKIVVDAVGGGGGGAGGYGGGRYDSSNGGTGGGGGASGKIKKYKEIYISAGSSIAITIGTGGVGGTGGNPYSSGTNGSSGGSTIVGSVMTLAGGAGGSADGTGGAGGTDGVSGKAGTESTTKYGGAGGAGGNAGFNGAGNGGAGGTGGYIKQAGESGAKGGNGIVIIYMEVSA